jgi:hypothetical protein
MSTFAKLALGGLVVVALIAAGMYYLMPRPVATTPPEGVICTMEAKLCPDGSYVGRGGPNCEFTACPTPTPITGSAKVGGQVTIDGTSIGVLNLVEDSRCPVDVQCIQAGTVRVRTSINAMNRDFIFTLGQAQEVNGVTISLIAVSPAQKNSKVTVPPSDYVFTFSVTTTVDKG